MRRVANGIGKASKVPGPYVVSSASITVRDSDAKYSFDVADMGLTCAQDIQLALKEVANWQAYSYMFLSADFKQSFCEWAALRYNAHCEIEEIVPTLGITPALHAALKAICEKGDVVAIIEPVYGGFREAIKDCECKCVSCALAYKNGTWTIDVDALESLFMLEKPRALMFCNPHNPVGRVWSRQELESVVMLCKRYNVVAVSDDAFADLALPSPEAKGSKQVGAISSSACSNKNSQRVDAISGGACSSKGNQQADAISSSACSNKNSQRVDAIPSNVRKSEDGKQVDEQQAGSYTPLFSLCASHDVPCISCYSPAKGFNLASLYSGVAVISEPQLRQKFATALKSSGLRGPDPFACAGAIAAWRNGASWLDNTLHLLEENNRRAMNILALLNGIRVSNSEIAGLMWVDAQAIGLDSYAIKNLASEQGVSISPGRDFGKAGEGFFRLALGAPAQYVEEGLTVLASIFDR